VDNLSRLTTSLSDRYVVERELGAGGMATVYLARDLRHHRSVALKVLNPELGAVLGVERFLAEIRVTANLQHPNLLPLFDSGDADGSLFYVMPYVDGESLRKRLDREKQLPIDEALRIATAIAGALAYAHQHNVIHRDLKPENILLQAGQPVVADFGIALAVSNAGGTRITQTGLSLGTPQYMSPEQATGDRDIDGRADIYSLGAILYEMLTGDPPHVGSTARAIIARVLTERPRDVRVTRPSVPAHVDAAISRALEKLPADRWGTAAAFADALAVPSAAASPPPDLTHARARRSRAVVPWVAASLAVGALAGGGIAGMRRSSAAPARVARFVVEMPSGARLDWPFGGNTTALAFSPDGKFLVFNARSGGQRPLFLYSVDRGQATAMPGTEDGAFPVFSPDGKWIAFTGFDGMLKKVPVAGGTPMILCEMGSPQSQAAWVNGKTIVFTRTFEGLYRVSADGGKPELLSKVIAGQETARHNVKADPDGDLVYFLSTVGTRTSDRLGVVSLKTGKVTMFPVPATTIVGYARGHLLYLRSDGTLMAVPFDKRSFRFGAAVAVADSIDAQTLNAAVAFSLAGDLAYVHGVGLGQLVSVDAHGVSRPLSDQRRAYAHPRLSPDARRLAFDEPRLNSTDIWEFDLAASTFSRVTSGGVNDRPEWFPDGKRLAFSSNAGQSSSVFSIWSELWDASTPAVRVSPETTSMREAVVSSDGKTLVYRIDAAERQRDILMLPLADGRASGAATMIVGTNADELMPRISPQGLLAYISNETGHYEVYVRPLHGDGGRVAVSNAGGTEPVWSRDGKRLFYRNGPQLVEASIVNSPVPAVTARRTLFEGNYLGGPYHANYDVFPDGEHFVMVKPGTEERKLGVILGWSEELKARIDEKR
jgi:serine/threonine-protein kinase